VLLRQVTPVTSTLVPLSRLVAISPSAAASSAHLLYEVLSDIKSESVGLATDPFAVRVSHTSASLEFETPAMLSAAFANVFAAA